MATSQPGVTGDNWPCPTGALPPPPWEPVCAGSKLHGGTPQRTLPLGLLPPGKPPLIAPTAQLSLDSALASLTPQLWSPYLSSPWLPGALSSKHKLWLQNREASSWYGHVHSLLFLVTGCNVSPCWSLPHLALCFCPWIWLQHLSLFQEAFPDPPTLHTLARRLSPDPQPMSVSAALGVPQNQAWKKSTLKVSGNVC